MKLRQIYLEQRKSYEKIFKKLDYLDLLPTGSSEFNFASKLKKMIGSF